MQVPSDAPATSAPAWRVERPTDTTARVVLSWSGVDLHYGAPELPPLNALNVTVTVDMEAGAPSASSWRLQLAVVRTLQTAQIDQ